MAICYIGLGSNLGNRRENIKRAIALLKKNQGLKVKKVSRIIETKPVGYLRQPKFLNGVIKIETGLSPQELLKELKGVEKKMGRKKALRFGPRAIDLDILLYGQKKIKQRGLTIPHPRMLKRDFVMRPLSEIAPVVVKRIRRENN